MFQQAASYLCFTFDDVDACSDNKTDKEEEFVAVAAPKNNKTEQAAFKAALKEPVAFHQEPDEDGYYLI